MYYLYRHFDDEIDSNNINSSTVWTEIKIDKPFQTEFISQIQNYASNVNKFQLFFLSLLLILFLMSLPCHKK
jgi:hypothetical protein